MLSKTFRQNMRTSETFLMNISGGPFREQKQIALQMEKMSQRKNVPVGICDKFHKIFIYNTNVH